MALNYRSNNVNAITMLLFMPDVFTVTSYKYITKLVISDILLISKGASHSQVISMSCCLHYIYNNAITWWTAFYSKPMSKQAMNTYIAAFHHSRLLNLL